MKIDIEDIAEKFCFWLKVALAAVAAAFVVVMASKAANAQDERWATKLIWQRYHVCEWDGCAYRWRQVRRRVYQAPVYAYRREAEDAWERRDPSQERGINCKDDVVRVVGGLHLTKEGALNDAVRQWQSTVRYDSGERYMDIESARGYVWRCDRAGTNETLAGRVGEVLTGGNGFQRRCVVLARPCRMPLIRGDEDKR